MNLRCSELLHETYLLELHVARSLYRRPGWHRHSDGVSAGRNSAADRRLSARCSPLWASQSGFGIILFHCVEWIGITERSCVITLMYSKRWLRKEALFVQRLIISCSSLRCSSKARVKRRITQFYLPPTRLSTSGMNHTSLYCPATEHHHTLADTHFPPFWG